MITTPSSIKEAITAARVLAEWLGDGAAPVPREQAESRAMICAGGPEIVKCPLNKHSGWWDTAKDAIAGTMRRQIEQKKNLNLSLPNESELGVCTACGCCLPLKVWVPIKHIASHTDAETAAQFPTYCWIKQEISQNTP